jgi:hypothetical protein
MQWSVLLQVMVVSEEKPGSLSSLSTAVAAAVAVLVRGLVLVLVRVTLTAAIVRPLRPQNVVHPSECHRLCRIPSTGVV